jgi:preprotein translocase subunit SecE
LEEAQLISWPTPGKALLDTVLVLAIVAATGAMLFSLNVLLADVSGLWYSR